MDIGETEEPGRLVRGEPRRCQGAEDEKREVVQNALVELIDQFTGGSAVAKSGKISIEELKNLMQGVTEEGLSLGEGDADFLFPILATNEKSLSSN